VTPRALVLLAASLGVAWNAFGVVQFVSTLRADAPQLMMRGMTAAQADVMANTPLWMTAAFAVGVFGGLLGCVLLLLKSLARPLFAASLVGYVALFIGDITEGVFAVFGAPQVAVLTFVVVVAAALWATSRFADRRGLVSA
jgi:hypothetical protein